MIILLEVMDVMVFIAYSMIVEIALFHKILQ